MNSGEYENEYDLDIDISPVTENAMSDASQLLPTTALSVDSVESLADDNDDNVSDENDNDVVDEKDSSESSNSDDEGTNYLPGLISRQQGQ